MEGVGARLGRSSTRYGPTTVFNGRVRKWKKKWIHVSPSSNASSNHHHSQTNNRTTNGTNVSHLLLYKWTPITQSQNNHNNNNNGDKISAQDDVAATTATEDPPRRKFKYIPIAVLEEQKSEAAEKVDEPSDTEPNAVEKVDEPTSKSDGFDGKPDINDVPMEETQAPGDNPLARQDLNKSTLDLSLGLAHDCDNDSKTDQTKDGQLGKVNSSSAGT
ncbi:uncharacterized protein LOC132267494 [Cornus florida]|uniref:uncharacterized protein LOC132267494 n=1 Tax=Cornus florida TaxID=4283 RepID=UPI00289F7F9B|nr:uncharacterized protein LOC132267494 [Cornus florida]